MLPQLTKDWIAVASLHVDLALKRMRFEDAGAEVQALAAGALAAQSARCAAAGPALVARMAARLGLSVEEELVAWVLAAGQLAPELAGRIEVLAGPEVTLGALAAIAYAGEPARAVRELGPEGALFRFGLVESMDDARAATPAWARRTMRATDAMLALALGAAGEALLEPGLAGSVRIGGGGAAIEELAVAGCAVEEARRAMRAARGAVVVASGMPGLGRRTLLAAAAREAGIDVLEVDARRLARDAAALSRQLRAIARECRLRARVPLLANLDALAGDKEHDRLASVGAELVALLDGLVLATTGSERPAIAWDRPVILVELPQPATAQRAELWRSALGEGTAEDAALLADAYPLAPALIHRAAAAAKARAGDRPLAPEDIAGGIRAVLDDRLGQYAKRVAVTQSWQDLVLPADQLDAIVELMARIRERRRVYEDWGFAAKVGKGLGVSALFSGPPGTGKTMVAALIARDLGLELYQVDLAKVVSKWIGETEQHLAALFDAAEAGHAILLFDEADALFGKRTEVRSSNDRYANLETSYLLQRLETFTGICLLTSNHESHIDPAFQRRLSLHLRFELPEVAERAALWRAMLPGAAPTAEDIDLGALARRYAMSGGYIRNAVLRAAFLAANDGAEIRPAHLERAARLEYEGMGKLAM